MRDLQKDMKLHAEKVTRFLERDLPEIIATETLNHIKTNFDREGFVDSRTAKWKPRKTTDERGRDNTRYRTNRRGRKGSLNSYGQKIKGRAILTGHNTGGNKLRNSYRARTSPRRVVIFTYKPYAKRHNEGTDGMPQRKHVGASKVTDKRIEAKITKTLDTIYTN